MHHHYLDRYAYGDSPIHRLDPRAKVLMVLGYTLALISLPRYELPSPWYAVLPVVLLAWGGVPAGFVLRRILWASPFVVFLVVLAPVFDRAPVRFHGHELAGGWLVGASVLLRFVGGLAALTALASTTRFPRLLLGLGKLGMPRGLVVQLQFLYRYLFLLMDQVMHLRRAIAVRDGGRGGVAVRWRSRAGAVGVMLTRTLEQAERTHQAMRARGYDGRIRVLAPLRWRACDTVAVMATAGYLVSVRWWW